MAARRFCPTLFGRCPLRLTAGICLAVAALSAGAAGYQSLAIVSPADQATIHDDNGRISINAAVSPPLREDVGDRFVFIIDGVPMLPSRNDTFSVEQMDRGRHTLQVEVVDVTGSALISSAPTTVYMWEASALPPTQGQPELQPRTQPGMQPPSRPPGPRL